MMLTPDSPEDKEIWIKLLQLKILESYYKVRVLKAGSVPNPRILYLFQFNLDLDAIILDDMALSYEEVEIIVNLLALLPKVKLLSLNRCQLDDIKAAIIFEVVSVAPALVSLSVDSNCFAPEIMKNLAQSLKTSRNLREISLINNNIGDAGLNYLAKVIPFCPSLCKLVLNKNSITDYGVKELCANLIGQKEEEDDSSSEEEQEEEGLKKDKSFYKLSNAKAPQFKVTHLIGYY
jgi:hypothetical protein